MEEDIPTRYCFVMLLAIADPHGYVVGTDIALARRLNMPLPEFQQCIAALTAPDPDSNSEEMDGRRVIESDGERGYFLVNYRKYRETKDEDQRRDYMRNYMRTRRQNETSVNTGKHPLGQAEEEAKAETEEEAKKNVRTAPAALVTVDAGFEVFWHAYPKRKARKDAEKAWAKLKPSSGLVAVMVAAIEAQRRSPDWIKDGGQFIPYPATWLNRAQWTDQPLELPQVSERTARSFGAIYGE